MVWSRTLHFVSNNLTRDATLYLTFDDIELTDPVTSKDLPPCLNIIRLPSTGPASATIHYVHDLAFIKPQVNEDDFVSPRTFVRVQPGESTELKLTLPTPPKLYEWTPAVKDEKEKGLMTAENKTEEAVDIAFGFILDEHTAKSALVLKNLKPNNKFAVQFTPVLRGYIGFDLAEGSVVKASAMTKCLFKQDLALLKDVTTWVVKCDTEGMFSISVEEAP